MRFQDWPNKMYKAMNTAGGEGFKWGSNDCCLYACDVAKAMTGKDYAKIFRGRYSTRIGAVQALRKFGENSLRKTITKIVGPEISLLKCARGDFVLANQGRGDMLGICTGAKAAFLTDNGFVYISIKDSLTAWRIG